MRTPWQNKSPPLKRAASIRSDPRGREKSAADFQQKFQILGNCCRCSRTKAIDWTKDQSLKGGRSENPDSRWFRFMEKLEYAEVFSKLGKSLACLLLPIENAALPKFGSTNRPKGPTDTWIISTDFASFPYNENILRGRFKWQPLDQGHFFAEIRFAGERTKPERASVNDRKFKVCKAPIFLPFTGFETKNEPIKINLQQNRRCFS